jgi:hypothetical protein
MRSNLRLSSLAFVFVLSGCLLNTKGIDSGTTGAGGSGGSGGGTGGEMTSTTSTSTTSSGMGGATSSTSGSGGTGGGNIICNDGDTQSCYSGLPGTQDVGSCQGGTQTCAKNAWGPCEGEVLPEATDVVCDGVDSDCDGDDDEAEGCATFEVSDTCQGVLLISGGSTIVPEGSSPDAMACYNGTVKWYVNPGDTLYILEDDDMTTVRVLNAMPMTIETKVQIATAKFNHVAMLQQYQFGGFSTNGLTQMVTPVLNGNDYDLVHKPSAARTSFVFSF